MIFDLNLAGQAVVELDGEGSVTLNDRWGRGGRGGRCQMHVHVLSGNLTELSPQGFELLKVLGGDLKVARFTLVRREDGLWLGV